MRLLSAGLLLALAAVSAGQPADDRPVPPLQMFFDAASSDVRTSKEALEALAPLWRDGYTSMIIDLARLLRPAGVEVESGAAAAFPDGGMDDGPEPGAGRRLDDMGAAVRRRPTRESLARARLVQFLERQTGKRFDPQLRGWRTWMWSLPYAPHPGYAEFKGALYGRIDRRMARFFPPDARTLIRLDEVDWGGVVVNGIPPLYYPAAVPVADAGYLRDGHIVFGVVVNGEARAYPKRILAWHEMARDRVGGVELHVVYCTLCGTVLPYESVAGNRTWRFGTSGLLYRSNKLMFDEETGSLWSTLEGRPVVGELVDAGLQLQARPVVTTTWGEWRRLHPATTVLAIPAGHDRDYREGAAYRDYFSHDALYFQVPHADDRLRNKAEVLTFTVRPAGGGTGLAVAIAQDLLEATRVYPLEAAGRHYVVVTSRQGANRLYALGSSPVAFESRPRADDEVIDADGGVWRVTEEALIGPGVSGRRLPRVSAQRAFWFGWRAQYPETVLLK